MRYLHLTHKCLFVFIIFFSTLLQATVSEVSVTSTTVSDSQTENSTLYIYGGIAGACTTSDNITTCDSCTGTNSGDDSVACNPQRVYTGLSIDITFKSDQSGQACIEKSDGTLVTGPIAYTSGSSITLSLPWSTVCTHAAVSPSTACDASTASTYTSSASVTYKLGIDTNGSCGSNGIDDGQNFNVVVAGMPNSADSTEQGSIENFRVHPGDKKVYLKDLSGYNQTGYSVTRGSANISNILTFCTVGDCATGFLTITNKYADPGSFLCGSTSVDSSGILADNRVRDLTNDVEHVFKLAVQDKAKNIGLFTNPTTGTGDLVCTDDTHTAHPQEVFGLLEEGSNCFIATAAYGSILDPHVDTFRNFRDQFLLKNILGRRFVKFYYKHSPKWANIISENQFLRISAQIFLFPLWLLSTLYLKFGIVKANLVFALFLFGLFWIFKARKNQRAL